MDFFSNTFSSIQAWTFEHAVSPFLYLIGLARYTEAAFDGVEWLMWGVIEIFLLWALIRPLEIWRPAQQITNRREVFTDFLYTLLHRLGGFALITFILVQTLVDEFEGELRYLGIQSYPLDGWIPESSFRSGLSFLVYLIFFDFVDYWIHRAQHGFKYWWHFHALHHSQRNMTLWSDNRNHLIDDLMRDAIFAVLAIFASVPPGQFILIIIFSRSLQSFQHANIKIHLGWLEKILVSPMFHRKHHAVEIGHSGPQGTAKQWGVNFAVLFPVWDVLFNTADFKHGNFSTGVLQKDKNGTEEFLNHGAGFWVQQWTVIKNIFVKF